MAFSILFKMILAYLVLVGGTSVRADAEDVPRKLFLVIGQNSTLPCGDNSALKLGNTITWFRDGHVLTSYRADNDHQGTLELKVVDIDDSGAYRCRVTTKDGPARDHVIYVEVIVSPLNVSIRTDNNNDFEAGNPRVLACVVYGGVPLPTVTWYLGDTILSPNVFKEVNRGNFTVSSLTFVPSLIDNGKELVCKATNQIEGPVFEDRVTVSVGHRPKNINSEFQTIGAISGESETLVCMVESEPEPEQFIWTFADGRTIYTSSKILPGHDNRYTSTLVWVPREDDFGPLSCRASNRFGEQKVPCTFSVIKGGPPTTPECEMFWVDQITLKVWCNKNWDGGRPQTIHLEVKGPDGIRKVSRKGLELEVSSLDATVNITAELYASNDRGKSSTIRLALMSETESVQSETPYSTKPSPESVMVLAVTVLLVIILVLIAVFYCIYMCIQDTIFERKYNRSLSRENSATSNDLELMDIVPSMNAIIPRPFGHVRQELNVNHQDPNSLNTVLYDCEDCSGDVMHYQIDETYNVTKDYNGVYHMSI